MTKSELIEQAERIETAHAAYLTVRAVADKAVWPEVEQAKADAEAAWDAWQELER